MAHAAALDRAAEHAHTRAEDEVHVRPLVEHPAEPGQLAKRRREVRVPEADELGARVERGQQPLPHGLGLAQVALQVEDEAHAGRLGAQPLQDLERGVAAAVVDEAERQRVLVQPEAPERLRVEAGGLVVARHDEDDAGGDGRGRRVLEAGHLSATVAAAAAPRQTQGEWPDWPTPVRAAAEAG